MLVTMAAVPLDRRSLLLLGAWMLAGPGTGARTLGDGSRLWREPGAVLDVDVAALLRRLVLHAGGVALRPSADRRPFVVDLPQGRLHVAGAHCRVRCLGAACELVVFSGAVDVAPVAGRTRRVTAGASHPAVVHVTRARL